MRTSGVIASAARRSSSWKRWIAASLTLLALTAIPAFAIEEPLADRQLEARAQNIFRELKCVVCVGESIAESQSRVAADMRNYVRTQVSQGKSEQEIIGYFVAHYGEQVRMRPPLSAKNALLWAAPLVMLLAGAALAWRTLFGKKAS